VKRGYRTGHTAYEGEKIGPLHLGGSALFCYEKVHSCTDALPGQTARRKMHFEAIHKLENPAALEV
jgi:hypothetical protein